MAGEEVMNNAGFSYLGINKMPAALTENEDEICLSSSTYACNGSIPGGRCCVRISSDVALYSINIDSDKMATVRHTSDFRCFDFSSSEWN